MELTDRDFEEEVLRADMPVMVDFWASWCPPCKMTEPIVDKLLTEYEGKVRIFKLNVDRNPLTAGRYDIQGVPTFITFKDGEIIDRKVAAQPEKVLRQMLEALL